MVWQHALEVSHTKKFFISSGPTQNLGGLQQCTIVPMEERKLMLQSLLLLLLLIIPHIYDKSNVN